MWFLVKTLVDDDISNLWFVGFFLKIRQHNNFIIILLSCHVLSTCSTKKWMVLQIVIWPREVYCSFSKHWACDFQLVEDKMIDFHRIR